MEFDVWFEKLKDLAISKYGYEPEAAETFDSEEYKDFFLQGYTPKEALDETESDGEIDWSDDY